MIVDTGAVTHKRTDTIAADTYLRSMVRWARIEHRILSRYRRTGGERLHSRELRCAARNHAKDTINAIRFLEGTRRRRERTAS